MNRIKSLDGIRAISILMVLFGHALETMPENIRNLSFLFYPSNAALGVRVFFVISGYLITRLLLEEREKAGRIDVKDFYLRRIFRIFPVFYLYILIVLILKWSFIPNIFTDYSQVTVASLYAWNYNHLLLPSTETGNGWWFLGHFWSLAMEEQFYMLWPLMFVKINQKLLIKIIVGVVLIMPFLRIATCFIMPDNIDRIDMMLQTGGDSILIGCLGAFAEKSQSFRERWFKYLNNRTLVLFVFLLVFIISPTLYLHFKRGYNLAIGLSITNVCIMILIFWCIYIPSKIAVVLNSKVFVRIGVLSYSLYIWQQLFLTNLNNFWVNKFPLNLIVSFVVAYISYYVVEKPILKLKKKYFQSKLPAENKSPVMVF